MAQNNLGVMYQYGLGVEKDYAKAIEWYTKSAYQGDSYAQYEVGNMLENGLGVEKDLKRALEFYTKAVNQGKAKERLKALQNK